MYFLVILEEGSPKLSFWLADNHLPALFSCGAETERERSTVISLPLLVRTHVLVDQGPTFMASFNLNDLLKGLASNYSHTEDLRLQPMNLGVGTQLNP